MVENEDLPTFSGSKATNKELIVYLRELLNGMRKSMKSYKEETDRKIEKLYKETRSNEEVIKTQNEQVRTELNDNMCNTSQGDVRFKNQIKQKVDDLTKRCQANEEEIKKQYEYMTRQVDIDIGQTVSRC